MTRKPAPRPATAAETFLAPLAAVTARHPAIEAEVHWARDGAWPDDAAPVQVIDSEEVCFYAEGMLDEGFAMTWDVLGPDPARPALIRMGFWQGPAPAARKGDLPVIAHGDWTAFLAQGLAALEHACAAEGNRLFTVTLVDMEAGVARRAHTSHPVEYPAQGTKPLTRDAWFEQCIVRAEPFVANTPEAFRDVFFDHALITSMGLGSALNLPVRRDDGTVHATVNLLAGAEHFTPARIARYTGIVAGHRALILALR